MRLAARLAMWLALAPLSTGCVMVYQPLEGLHRPVAIDLRYANFADVSFELTCESNDEISSGDAKGVCRKLTVLFESQGAHVEASNVSPPDAESAEAKAKKAAQLQIRLSARVLQKKESSFLWWTTSTEFVVAQDVVVRDETGFLLARDTLVGRFTERFGFDQETHNVAFSKDFYSQIAQTALNAKLHRQVLRESAAP